MTASLWVTLAVAALGVAGTLGGAYLGGWLTNLRERTQWSRDQQQRARDQREERYGDFLALSEEIQGLLVRFWESPSPAPSDLVDDLNDKVGELRKHVGRFQVTEATTVLRLAYEVLNQVTTAYDIAVDAHGASTPSLTTAHAFQGSLRALRRAMRTFRDAARMELGT